MQKYLIFFSSLLMTFLFFSQVKSDSIYHFTGESPTKIGKSKGLFNFSTDFEGRVDSNGSIYNSYGDYLGRLETYNKRYDSFGGFKGRIDEFGNMYDSLGSYQGKLERNGNFMILVGVIKEVLSGNSGINLAIKFKNKGVGQFQSYSFSIPISYSSKLASSISPVLASTSTLISYPALDWISNS